MKKRTLFTILIMTFLLMLAGYSKALAESASQCELCHIATDGSSVVANFNEPIVAAVLDKTLPANKTANCIKCHNDSWHPDLATRVNISPFGYFTSANSLDYPASVFHDKHRGNFRSDNNICRSCHGTTTALETYYNTGKDWGPYPNGRVNCTLCHVYVPHKDHGNQNGTYWLAQGGTSNWSQNFNQSNLSCLTANCHGGNVQPAVLRTDGKQLCVNCHNAGRDGYEIDKNGHLKTDGGQKDLNDIHNSNFTIDPLKDPNLNCTDCHQSSSDLTTNTIDLSGYHKGLLGFNGKECTTCHSNNKLPKDPTKNLNDDVIKNQTLSNTDKTYCDKCHTLTHLNAGAAKTFHTSTFPTISTSVGQSTDNTCLNCHTSSNFIDEHADKAMTPLNGCTICHNNPNPQPKSKTLTSVRLSNVILTGGANCNSCHDVNVKHQNVIDNKHTSNYFNTQTDLSVDCLQCHQNVLDREHLTKDANSTGKLMNCDSCHNNSLVKDKIKNATSGIFDPLNPPATDCITCHNSGTLGSNHQIHPNSATDNHKVNFNTVNGLTCTNCHSGMDTISSGHVNKKDSSGKTYMTCNTCHSDTTVLPKDSTKTVKSVIDQVILGNIQQIDCSTCHQIHAEPDTLHGTVYMDDPKTFDCSQCHKNTLNNEHSGTNVNTGKVMDCNTCHSANAQLPNGKGTVQSIVDKFKDVANSTDTGLKTKCTDCHTTPIHDNIDGKHSSNFLDTAKKPFTDLECTKCHDNRLNIEHKNRNTDCSACHNSNRVEVQAAIITQNTSCDACHTNVHPSSAQTAHTVTYPTKSGLRCADCHTKDANNNDNPMNIVSFGHVGRLDSNNKTMTCNTCHDNTSYSYNGKTVKLIVSDLVTNKFNGQNVSFDCNTCHNTHPDNLPTQHTTVYPSSNGLNCANCHTKDLKDGTNPMNIISTGHLGRNDKNGNQMTCGTCHINTSFQVQGKPVKDYIADIATNKINNGTSTNVNCSTCHGDIHPNNEETQHTTVYPTVSGLSCNDCHGKDKNNQDSPMNIVSTGHINRNDLSGNSMSCNTCHESNSVIVNNGKNTTVKDFINNYVSNKLKGIKQSNINCASCHIVHNEPSKLHITTYMVNPLMDCGSCHQKTLEGEHAVRKDKNGNTMNCNTCHKSDDSKLRDVIKKYSPFANSNDPDSKAKCSDCHTIHPEPSKLHTSSYVENQLVNCSNCHKNTLNDEHASHVDINGNAYNCATCHNNSRPQVREAILGSKTNCDSCHTISHNDPVKTNTIHVTSFIDNEFINCSGCHKSTLSEEHLSRVKTDGTTYSCNTCHEDPRVKVIINSSPLASTQFASILSLKSKAASVSIKTKCNTCHTVHKDANDAHWKQYDYDSKSKCMGCHQIHPKN